MDRKDTEIIDALLTREGTVHEVSKAVYKTRDQNALRRHNSFVRYRLRKLVEDGLVRRRPRKDGKSVYFVPLGDITYGEATVVVRQNGASLAVDLGRALITDKKGGERRILIFP
jgi:DNA-binding transcriptional ArsR family regulator